MPINNISFGLSPELQKIEKVLPKRKVKVITRAAEDLHAGSSHVPFAGIVKKIIAVFSKK